MNQQELAKLKASYSYSKGNYKYIPMASEILKYIGQNVVLVTFKKNWTTRMSESGEEVKEYNWTDLPVERAEIISINDYDPITMTYKCKYKVEGNDEEKEVRIQPEGFEFCNTEDESVEEFVRFVPYSYHFRMAEDEFTFSRIAELYEKRDTLELEALRTIADSKNQGQILRYSNNIGAAIKLEDGTLLWIRLYTLRLKHRQGNKFGLFFSSDEQREWSTVITSDDKSYNIGDWGTMKIIDLSDEN